MKKGEKKKVEFNNRAIHNWKSDFSPGPKSKSGKDKERVYTSFGFDETTQFKGLNQCEYVKGEKHFLIILYYIRVLKLCYKSPEASQKREFILVVIYNNFT